MKKKLSLCLIIMLISVALSINLVEAADNWTGTIKVWDFPRPPHFAKWEQDIFKQFEEDHPGVKIEYTKLSWGKGDQKLDISVAAGNPPDICGSGAKVKYAKQGILEPIDPYLSEADNQDFYSGTLDAFKWNGKIWGWPMYSVVGVVALNTDIFAERNVPLPKNGQWTWDEFLETAQKLTFDRDGDGEIDVYGLTFHPDGTEYWGLMYADGVYPLNDDMTEYTFDTPEAVASFQKIIDLIDKYKVCPPNVGGFIEQNMQYFLRQRQSAMTMEWAWILGTLKKHNEDVKEGKVDEEPINWTIVNYPTGKSGEVITSSPGVGAWGVFKQKNKAKKDIIMELAKILTSTEAQMSTLAEIGTLPSRKSAAKMYDGDPYMSVIADAHAITVPFHPDWNKMMDSISREMQLSLLGKKSAEEALTNAGDKARKLLDK